MLANATAHTNEEQQKDDSLAAYRGISEDEILNREGVSPQQYLEFTEVFESTTNPPLENDTVKSIDISTISSLNHELIIIFTGT